MTWRGVFKCGWEDDRQDGAGLTAAPRVEIRGGAGLGGGEPGLLGCLPCVFASRRGLFCLMEWLKGVILAGVGVVFG